MEKNLIERRRYKISGLELRAEEGQPMKMSGYVVMWDQMADLGWYQERVRKGAFSKSLSERGVKALWNHNTDMVLGSTKNGTLSLTEDERGLYFECEMPNTTAGRDHCETIRRGDVDGTSFGFVPVVTEWDTSNPDQSIRTIVEAELYEISPTPFPAYEGASSVSVRSTKDIYEEYQREMSKRDKEKQSFELLKLRQKQLEISC